MLELISEFQTWAFEENVLIGVVGSFVTIGVFVWGVWKFLFRSARNVASNVKAKLQERAGWPEIQNLASAPAAQHFVERREMADLAARVARAQVTAVTNTVTGMGGVGKTTLALAVARQEKKRFRGVWVIRAANVDTIRASLDELASAMKVEGAGGPDRDAIARRALDAVAKDKDPWLLVYDNADDPEEVQRYVPGGGDNISLLFTSRSRAWPAESLQELGRMTRDESVELLSERLPGRDPEELDTVADRLGDWPLALNAAAAYLQNPGVTVEAYLQEFEVTKDSMTKLDWSGSRSFYADPETTATITAALRMTTDQLDTREQVLLSLLCWLNPDDLWPEMLESGVRSQIHKPFGDQRLPEVLIAEATEGWVAAAMGSLELQNLVSNENDTWRMHRLIGEFWRAMLGADANTWRRSVSQIVNSRTGRFTAQYNWSDFRRLVPHALSLLGLGAEDRAAARLFGQIGGFALSYGIQPGDIRFAETSVAIHEKIAPESESLAASLNNLAEFQRYDNLKLAIATCKRVCDITAGLPDVGPAHPNYAIALSNLGTNYVRNKDLEKSEALFLDALRIDKSALGETHPQTTTDYRNLGGLYYELAAVNQGAVADAFRAKEAQVTEQALNLTLESLGPYHPEVATDRNNVAVMWDRDGRSEDALSLMAQAAATSVDLLGPGHEQAISTLGAYLNMAIVADAPLESAVLELKEVVIELKTLHRDWGKQRLGEIAARLGIELNDPEALLKALSAEQKRLHAEGAYEERIRWEVEQVQEALHAVTLEPHPSPQFQTNLIAALQALGIEVN